MVEFTPDVRYCQDFADMMSGGTRVEYRSGRCVDAEYRREATGSVGWDGTRLSLHNTNGSLLFYFNPRLGQPFCLHGGVTYAAYDPNPQGPSHVFLAFAPPGVEVPAVAPDCVRVWARAQCSGG